MEPCESCGKLTSTGCPLCEKKGKKWKCCKKCEKGEKYAKHIKKHQTSAKTPTIEVKRFGEEMEGEPKRVKQDGGSQISINMKPKDKKKSLKYYIQRVGQGAYPVIGSVQEWYSDSEAVGQLKEDMQESLYYDAVHWLALWHGNPKAVVYFLLSKLIQTFAMKMSNSDGEKLHFHQLEDWQTITENAAEKLSRERKAQFAKPLKDATFKLCVQLDTTQHRAQEESYNSEAAKVKYRFLVAAWNVFKVDGEQRDHQILDNHEGEFARFMAYSACATKGLNEGGIVHYWPPKVYGADFGTELHVAMRSYARSAHIQGLAPPSVLKFEYNKGVQFFMRTDTTIPEKKSTLTELFE